MSRFEEKVGQYTAVYGVDHATGTYCQVWLNPTDERDCALIVIDNMGVRVELVYGHDGRYLSPEVTRFLEGVRARYRMSRVQRPNIDAETVAKLFVLFGFPDMTDEISCAFD